MAKIRSYFLAVRLGLLEHIEDGRLSFDCLGVWLYLAMKCKAGKDNGVVMTNDAALAAAGNMTKRQVATARRKLETMGFIRKMHDGHRKGKYAIILHRYQPTRGSQEVFVDALATTDCNNPVMVPGSHADLITTSSGLQEDPIATSSGTLIAHARREERLEDRVQRKEEEENPGPSGPASPSPIENHSQKDPQVPTKPRPKRTNGTAVSTRPRQTPVKAPTSDVEIVRDHPTPKDVLSLWDAIYGAQTGRIYTKAQRGGEAKAAAALVKAISAQDRDWSRIESAMRRFHQDSWARGKDFLVFAGKFAEFDGELAPRSAAGFFEEVETLKSARSFFDGE